MTNWRTQGSKIYYKDKEVSIRGTNYFGFETNEVLLKGLDHHSMYALIHNVKKLGFNAIRVPFSLETIWRWNDQARQDKIKDPQDKNKSVKQLMLDMAWMMRDANLILMIDMHRLRIDLPGGQNAITPLWYSNEQGLSTEAVIDGWKQVAEAFKDVPNVWFSLKNEPHSDERGSSTIGTGNPATDWDKAAIQIAREIAKIKKDTIFLIMGIQIYNSNTKGQISSGWGQILQGFLEHPLPKDLNYALEFHCYGTGVRPGYWYEPGKTQQEWQREFGDVIDSRQMPCICSEFGAPVWDSSYELKDQKMCQNSCDWEYAFGDYMKNKQISFFQWACTPHSNDSGSILKEDWDFSKANKIKLDICQKACPNPTQIYFG